MADLHKETYRLCLIKGFVTVKRNPDPQFWFPRISFYDDRGLLLFTYPEIIIHELYDSLKLLSNDEPPEKEINISVISSVYCIYWHRKSIYISKSDSETPLVIINLACAKELLNLIQDI